MPILHDLRCTGCGVVDADMGVVAGDCGRCRKCGAPRVIDWSHGKAPATDLRAPMFNHATGQYHRSSREADMAMAQICRERSERLNMKVDLRSAGDKVGGARNDLTTHGSAWSYRGQGARTSTGERRGAGSATREQRPQARPVDRSVNGITPRSVTRGEMKKIKRSSTWVG